MARSTQSENVVVRSPEEQQLLEKRWLGKFVAEPPDGKLLSCVYCKKPFKVESVSPFDESARNHDGQPVRRQLYCLNVNCSCNRVSAIPMTTKNLKELYPSAFYAEEQPPHEKEQKELGFEI